MVIDDEFHIGDYWSCPKSELKYLIVIFILMVMLMTSLSSLLHGEINYNSPKIIAIALGIMLTYDLFKFPGIVHND